MSDQNHCPTDDLRMYLDDALDISRHAQLLAHLDRCQDCRQRIELQAGSDDDWKLAGQSLALCKLDASGNILPEHSLAEAIDVPPMFNSFPLAAILAPTDDPQSAGRIGTFEITGIIGSGGMGLVLKAREPALDRYVAIKMLAPHLARSQSARNRFAREARAAAAVIHDNVIAIYQVAEWNELPYIVMPYLPDPSLQQRIDDYGCLDLESTLSIGMQVARGLAAAHAQGLVHRDIKPANVLLAKGTERAIITDFGLARAADDATLTRIGLLAGTPHYMSPEQARGEFVDHKSDLFSMGSLLYAMTTGGPPIASEFGSETMQQLASGRVPSLQSRSTASPAWFTKLVDWLHQPQPSDRPESASHVAAWLEQCLAHLRQPESQPLPECLLPARKVHRIRRVALLVGALFILAALAYPAWQSLKYSAELESNKENPSRASDTLRTKTSNVSASQPETVIASPALADWWGNHILVDQATQRSRALQTSIDETWKIMPQENAPVHEP